MGDGRFYTDQQFLTTVFITIQIIFVVISMMFSIYKNNDKENKSLLLLFVSVILILFFKFYETVVVSEMNAYMARRLQISFFILTQLLMLNFLYKTFVYQRKKSSDKQIRKMKVISYIGFSLISIILFVLSDYFIDTYTFNDILYNNSYTLFLSIAYLSIILSILYLKAKLPNTYKGYDKRYLLVILSLWALPILLYICLLFVHYDHISLYESCLYLLMVVSLNISVNYLIPYKVTLSIFNNVKDLIMDYVFIIDLQGRIVYKNKGTDQVDFFKRVKTINKDNLFEMFSIPIELRDAYDKRFIKVKDGKSIYYYSYTIKDIYNEGLEAGSIITFVDITHLITLLDDLKKQQNNTKRINDELQSYSKNVFDLEKEKEINVLLDEITKNQETSMKQLKDDIVEMLEREHLELTKTIDEAKKNLFDVRSAVSTYMQYYEGDQS